MAQKGNLAEKTTAEQKNEHRPVLQSKRSASKKASSEKPQSPSTKNKNVSRETLNKATLDKVKHDIQEQEGLEDKSVRLKELYSSFRENQLSRIESAFNAAYLYCADRYYSSHAPIKRRYKNIYKHPKAWQKHQHSLWKSNGWSVAVGALDVVPKVKRGTEKLVQTAKKSKPRADLWRKIEYSHMAREVYKSMTAVLGVVALVFALLYGTKGVIDMTNQVPAVSVYIDGAYIGDVLSVSDAENAKAAYESVVAMSMRTNYEIGCAVTYKPTLSTAQKILNPTQLNAAFDAASKKTMKNGYGLYVDGMLAAVCENRQWIDQALSDSLQAQLDNYKGIQGASYNNAITVSAGAFPSSLYMSQGQVRELFSLEKVTKADKEIIQSSTVLKDFPKKTDVLDNNSPSGQLMISSANLGSVPETSTVITDVSGNTEVLLGHYAVMNVAVQKEEVCTEPIEFKTIRIADPTLAENKTTIVQKGVDGKKDVTYLVSYVDDIEVERTALSENITVQPIDAVEIIGTRPLTEEEKRTASTGTYIWPSDGKVSSGYSWRVIFNKNEFHKGLDICDDFGSDVVASDGGLVIKAGMDNSGYGNMVLIQHDDGTITRYAHNSKLYVEEGQRVAQGEVIAAMGKTGQATGVHVHFEVIVNGSAKNPALYLPQRQ